MKLLLTGVTGAAGSQILRTAVSDSSISTITVLARRPLPAWMDISSNDKIEVIVLKDFLNYPSKLLPRLADHDACIWALGTPSTGLPDEEYTRITYEYTMAAVRALEEGGVGKKRDIPEVERAPFKFVFISSQGADQTERTFTKYGRIKGRTEKSLLDLPTSSNIRAYILRPAYFFPSRNVDRRNTRSTTQRAIDFIATPIMCSLFPSSWTPIEGLGRVAVEVAKGRWKDEQLYNNKRLKALLKTL